MSSGQPGAQGAAGAPGRPLRAPHRRQAQGPRLREKVVIAAYRASRSVLARLPLGPTIRIGGWAAEIVYLAWVPKRANVRANAAHVLGLPAGDRRVARLARAIFRNQVRWLVEGMHLADEARQREFGGFSAARLEEFHRTWVESQGVILTSLHIGNAEVVALSLAGRGWPFHALADDTAYDELFEEMSAVRRSLGVDMIRWRNIREIYRVLQRREMLGLLVDWGYRQGDQPVRLLGSWTTLPSGPALLAARTGATIVPVWTYRLPDGSHTGDMGDPIRVASAAPAEVARATQAVADALAVGIRAAPEQWVVFKRMWPDDPAEEARLAARAAAALGTLPGDGDGPAAGEASRPAKAGASGEAPPEPEPGEAREPGLTAVPEPSPRKTG